MYILSGEEISFIVKDFIQHKLNLKDNEITEQNRFSEDLGLSSLDLIDLQMEAEEKFDIFIPDEEAEKITTIGEFITIIARSVLGRRETV